MIRSRFFRSFGAAGLWLVAAPLLHAADFHDGLAAYNRGDYETARREWLTLAQAGQPEPQYRLARMYYHGEGGRDDAAAARWYRAAAEQGHLKAQNNLALLYEEGRGVDADLAAAVDWYRKAAEQGLQTAQVNLARMYDAGRGVDRDPSTAAIWYRKAAEQGHVRAQYRLGVMFDEGSGVEQDAEKAAKWYRKAAKQEHPLAQEAIGSMYAEGRGVSRDAAKATKWLSRASARGVAVAPLLPGEPDAPAGEDEAEESVAVADMAEEPVASVPADPVAPSAPATSRKNRDRSPSPLDFPALREIGRRAEAGEAEAQYRLAGMLSTGEGAPQSLDDAARWYLAAAEQGHTLAAYKVALLYLRGRGFPHKDFVQAYRWFSVAAELGLGDAAAWRDKIRPKMTDQEIAEADRILGRTEQ